MIKNRLPFLRLPIVDHPVIFNIHLECIKSLYLKTYTLLLELVKPELTKIIFTGNPQTNYERRVII